MFVQKVQGSSKCSKCSKSFIQLVNVIFIRKPFEPFKLIEPIEQAFPSTFTMKIKRTCLLSRCYGKFVYAYMLG